MKNKQKKSVTFIFIISMLLLSNTVNAQWQKINSPCTEDIMKSVFQENDTIYAFSDYEMYKSYDFGETWIEFKYVNTSGYFSQILKFGHNDSIFAVITVNGVFLSYNYGNTWTLQTLDPDPGIIGTYNPYMIPFYFDANDIYVSSNFGLYKLAENDSNFRQINTYASHYLKDSLIICHTSYDLQISNDNGTTWTTYPTTLQWPSKCFFKHQSDIYNCNMDGLFKSSDQGISWSDVSYLLPTTQNINSFFVCDSIWFLCTKDSILLQSNNFGNSWTISNGLAKTSLNSNMIVDIYKNNDTIYLAYLFGGIFKSTDEGLNWKHKSNGMKNSTLYSFVSCGDIVFAYAMPPYGAGLFRTFDNGDNWESINTNEIYQVTNIVSDSNNLYIADEKGLLLSSDLGNSWQRILPQNGILCFDVEGNTIICGLSSGHLISYDAGYNWNYGLITSSDCNGMQISGNDIYVSDYYLYHSNNLGNTFTAITSDPISNSINFDSDNTNIVITTLNDIYYSNNYGLYWDTITPNRPMLDYYGDIYIIDDYIFTHTTLDTILYCKIGVFYWQTYNDGLDERAGYTGYSDSYIYANGLNSLFRRPLLQGLSSIDDNISSLKVSVYPNPTDDIIYINLNQNYSESTQIDFIKIYNIQGQEVKEISPEKEYSDIEVNCSDLKPGIYIVSINAGEKVYSQRFIKN